MFCNFTTEFTNVVHCDVTSQFSSLDGMFSFYTCIFLLITDSSYFRTVIECLTIEQFCTVEINTSRSNLMVFMKHSMRKVT